MTTYVQTICEYYLLAVRELTWQCRLKAYIYCCVLHSRNNWRVYQYFRRRELL